MKALRHEVYICSDIETDAAEVQEKLRQAELAAQEERNESCKQKSIAKKKKVPQNLRDRKRV
jgi:hypothetical protein